MRNSPDGIHSWLIQIAEEKISKIKDISMETTYNKGEI